MRQGNVLKLNKVNIFIRYFLTLQLTIFNIAWYAYLQQYGDENIANNDHTKLTEKEDRYLAALTNVLQVTFDQLKFVKIFNVK